MESYVREKLSLASAELAGSPNRKKLQHVVARTLIAINASDLPDHVRARYEEAREILLQNGKLSSDTVSQLTDAQVRQVWRALQEVCSAAS